MGPEVADRLWSQEDVCTLYQRGKHMLQHKRRSAALTRTYFQAAGFAGIPVEYPSSSVRKVHSQPISFVCNGTGFDPTNLRWWLQDHHILLQVSDSLPGILQRARKTDKSREVRLVPEGQTYVPQDNKSLFVEELAELFKQLYTHRITEASFPFILVVSVLTKEGSSALLSVHCAHDAKVVIGRRIKASVGADL